MEFLNKIQNQEPLCYLNIREADAKMWNYLTTEPPLFNTRLLFRAAARPHFNYFLTLVDFISWSDGINLSMVEDKDFSDALQNISKIGIPRSVLMEQLNPLIRKNSFSTTLVTTREYENANLIAADKKIVLNNEDLFGNVEPVWRGLLQKLPKNNNIFFLSMGPEKFLIGPRLKVKFGLPVIDIGGEIKPKRTMKNIIKKFLSYVY